MATEQLRTKLSNIDRQQRPRKTTTTLQDTQMLGDYGNILIFLTQYGEKYLFMGGKKKGSFIYTSRQHPIADLPSKCNFGRD